MEGEGAAGRRGDTQPAKVGKRQRQQRDRIPAPSDPHARQPPTPCRRSSAVPATRSTSHAITAGTKLTGMAINGRRSGFEDSAGRRDRQQPADTERGREECRQWVLFDLRSDRAHRWLPISRAGLRAHQAPSSLMRRACGSSRKARRGAPATTGRVCTDLRDKRVSPRCCSVDFSRSGTGGRPGG